MSTKHNPDHTTCLVCGRWQCYCTCNADKPTTPVPTEPYEGHDKLQAMIKEQETALGFPADLPAPTATCNCDLRTRLVGDGCEVCNPELAKEMGCEPPAPTDAEVREAREYLEMELTPKDLHETEQIVVTVGVCDLHTILAALEQAQWEVENRDRLLDQIIYALDSEDDLTPQDIPSVITVLRAENDTLKSRMASQDAIRADLAAQAEQIKRLRDALAQIQRNASANRVWSGDKWTYLGLTYVAQTKIVRIADEALKDASK